MKGSSASPSATSSFGFSVPFLTEDHLLGSPLGWTEDKKAGVVQGSLASLNVLIPEKLTHEDVIGWFARLHFPKSPPQNYVFRFEIYDLSRLHRDREYTHKHKWRRESLPLSFHRSPEQLGNCREESEGCLLFFSLSESLDKTMSYLPQKPV